MFRVIIGAINTLLGVLNFIGTHDGDWMFGALMSFAYFCVGMETLCEE